ncbi:MAG TPA: C25 family cysteine peptidase [Bacteroidales bacterium]|nr:C25 family cysteine peptidase [Bacteroidales bacterium]
MLRKRLLIVLPENLRQHFSPLVDAWSSQNITPDFFEYRDKKLPAEGQITTLAAGYDAVMLAGNFRFAPRNIVSKPFMLTNEKKIPVSWLPVKNTDTLNKFINTAALVQNRKKFKIALGLLAQRNRQYLQVADKMENEFRDLHKDITYFRWTSELVFPEDMMSGINCGMGAVIYLGHGRPVGWAGYYGIRMKHFHDFFNEPAGCFLSLCCHTANRRNVALSFSENLVTEGIAASAFGSVNASFFTDNTRWAFNICNSLKKGIDTIGELITDAAPMNKSAISSYRLIGDPFAPIYATASSVKTAKKIKIYY